MTCLCRHRGEEQLYLEYISNLGTGGRRHAPAALSLLVQEARWDSRSVWTGAENLAATGIRSSFEQYVLFLG
jgi:hypothetical protein